MFNRLWSGADRRSHPRHEAAITVEIELEVYGFEGESRPFFASGSTVNISRSGLLARLDLPVARGSVCKLFFRHPSDAIRPQHVAGRVVRITERNEEFWIAVEFDEALFELDEQALTTESVTSIP